MSVSRVEDLFSRSNVRFGTSGARGLVADMTDEVCYGYAAAFLRTVAGTAGKVVLGHDLRQERPLPGHRLEAWHGAGHVGGHVV